MSREISAVRSADRYIRKNAFHVSLFACLFRSRSRLLTSFLVQHISCHFFHSMVFSKAALDSRLPGVVFLGKRAVQNVDVREFLAVVRGKHVSPRLTGS